MESPFKRGIVSFGPGVLPYLNTVLNSQLLGQFLFGIYTGLFAVTILMYLHQENRIASSKTIIVGSMTALYALTSLTIAIKWFYTNKRFCTDGDSRVDIFVGPDNSIVTIVLQIITQNSVAFIIADGVLVWRCFHACGQSFRSAILPITLLVLETLLVLSDVIIHCLWEDFLFYANSRWISINSFWYTLDGAMFVSVAATSLASTFIICWQVYAHTKPGSRSRRRYRNVIDALIQSSALYSSVLVIEAVLNIIQGHPLLYKGRALQNIYPSLLLEYFDVVAALVTGIAPTLMVARLIVSSYNEDTEVSSFSFPKDLITHPASYSNEPQANDNNIEDTGTQTNQSLRIGEADGDSLISLISRHA
ncbi:hypothetical protein D9613_012472 [Agrocybe pediades]|uniref:Uncharacterized protein n=1 Tax=Agrocybe pediades TaxID=84607 RepID=A0A8H4QS02_9AGAR|nr:hypothetical protein D9613_012472 [Agrocybe pediades]